MGVISRKQPLYDQLVDILRDKIDTEMEPGDLLPSERELSERYGLSRTTVRLALKELETLGLITRRHGKGTFVSDLTSKAMDLTTNYSFTQQMRDAGRDPKTIDLEFDTIEATKTVADRMGLRLGEQVLFMKRLRLADGVPMMVERTYVPASRFIGLTREALAGKSLYAIIENDYHETIRVAEEEFFASVARKSDAEVLRIAEGAPVLQLARVTYNNQNAVIEFTHSVARADQFKYKVSHVR
ncbi:GntR family transcriptional regulator [Paratractidigestivibacter sp.]|uniref:GntR family transcriptional regulator n=1 Tax=Paratractidigestivibacter sp. TaxID=2847316 RepID=UPI002ABDDE4B|nr:GntR family transcriptional regulator [Paratractidigestivibacter sp.]